MTPTDKEILIGTLLISGAGAIALIAIGALMALAVRGGWAVGTRMARAILQSQRSNKR